VRTRVPLQRGTISSGHRGGWVCARLRAGLLSLSFGAFGAVSATRTSHLVFVDVAANCGRQALLRPRLRADRCPTSCQGTHPRSHQVDTLPCIIPPSLPTNTRREAARSWCKPVRARAVRCGCVARTGKKNLAGRRRYDYPGNRQLGSLRGAGVRATALLAGLSAFFLPGAGRRAAPEAAAHSSRGHGMVWRPRPHTR
jgi:hypothetical protein